MYPHEITERNKEVTRLIGCCLVLLEHGAYETHRSRDHRDKQVKMLMEKAYQMMTGEAPLWDKAPYIKLAEERQNPPSPADDISF